MPPPLPGQCIIPKRGGILHMVWGNGEKVPITVFRLDREKNNVLETWSEPEVTLLLSKLKY
jgi:hypothetical protein